MGTERKEPAPERGERGQPALRNVSRRLLFRPVPGLDDMTTSSQCWRTGLVSAAPVGAQYRHFRGLSRWYAQDLAHFLENERCSNFYVPHPFGAVRPRC